MRTYLSEYIHSLSSRRQMKISRLLDNARVSKKDLSRLFDNLREYELPAFSVPRVTENSIIRSDHMRTNLLGLNSRMNELYEVSNLISTMLNSHSSILMSEINAIEHDIIASEKMVQNLAFLLSDNSTYDFGYLESFNDERGRSEEAFSIPDRSGMLFAEDEMASIDTRDSVLTLTDGWDRRYGIKGSLIRSNADAMIYTSTDVDRATGKSSHTGWMMNVISSGAATANLSGSSIDQPSVQVELEFRLDQASVCSAIHMDPISGIVNNISSIRIFASEDSQGVEVLDTPAVLDRPITVNFPLQSVSHFRVIVSQKTFNYIDSYQNLYEINYQKAISEAPEEEETSQTGQKAQRFIHSEISKVGSSPESLPSYRPRRSYGPLGRLNDIVVFLREHLWARYPTIGRSRIFTEVSEDIFSDEIESANTAERSRNIKILNAGDITDTSISERDIQAAGSKMNRYSYDLGIRYVTIGLQKPLYRGVFIARPFTAGGDIGELRIKSSEKNIDVTDSRHSKRITSVEYSVSNVPVPTRESDWVPIAPIDSNSIIAERLFVANDGRAMFRFPANSEGSISIYRNGFRVGLGFSYIYNELGGVDGVRMDRSAISDEDIFTCDYDIGRDKTTVNFDSMGFDNPSLVFASDENGSGEGFTTTGNLDMVTLGHTPYIDPDSFQDDNYDPIVVRLADGTIAENLTDYMAQTVPSLPETGYYFFHKGDTLKFNRNIDQPFRIYYQYLENNVRLRVVLRCNDYEFTSPQVEYVHTKAKTRRGAFGVL